MGTVKEFKMVSLNFRPPSETLKSHLLESINFHFSIIGREPIFKKPDDITATLTKYGKLTVKIERWENDKLYRH
jgi:hypothetical protein